MMLLPSHYDYLGVLLLGGAVGAAELVSRYRDHPYRALWTTPSGFYMALNGTAAFFSLWVVRHVWPDVIAASEWLGNDEGRRAMQSLLAVFGASALFRSGLFTLRVGSNDLAIGPNLVLQTLLAAADRAIDRLRAEQRSLAVQRIMQDVSYAKAKASLSSYCLALMQNVPAEEQRALDTQLATLDANDDITNRAKALILGLTLLSLVGEEVLDKAVGDLKNEISEP